MALIQNIFDSKNSSITDTSSLILNYKRENQTHPVTAKLKDQIPLLTDRTLNYYLKGK
jgi:hypothetical protein